MKEVHCVDRFIGRYNYKPSFVLIALIYFTIYIVTPAKQ